MAYNMISCIEVAEITQTLKIAELHLETSLRRIWHETFLGSRIIFFNHLNNFTGKSRFAALSRLRAGIRRTEMCRRPL